MTNKKTVSSGICIALMLVIVLSNSSITHGQKDSIEIINPTVYAEKIEGNQMVRHTGENDYEIWQLVDSFNSEEVQNDISNNEIELKILQTEYEDCNNIKSEKYAEECKNDVSSKIDFILGETAIFDTKLGLIK